MWCGRKTIKRKLEMYQQELHMKNLWELMKVGKEFLKENEK